MSESSYEYRVIRLYPEEVAEGEDVPVGVVLAPTEDSRLAVARFVIEAQEGEVRLQRRSVGEWESVADGSYPMSAVPAGSMLVAAVGRDPRGRAGDAPRPAPSSPGGKGGDRGKAKLPEGDAAGPGAAPGQPAVPR